MPCLYAWFHTKLQRSKTLKWGIKRNGNNGSIYSTSDTWWNLYCSLNSLQKASERNCSKTDLPPTENPEELNLTLYYTLMTQRAVPGPPWPHSLMRMEILKSTTRSSLDLKAIITQYLASGPTITFLLSRWNQRGVAFAQVMHLFRKKLFAIASYSSTDTVWKGSSSSCVSGSHRTGLRQGLAEAIAQILLPLHPSFQHPNPMGIC